MGLSPELLHYAENIWRRFPEIFISLGSPDVEDVFELKEAGSWRHCIVDTLSEKVIEIVLPRRGSRPSSFEVLSAPRLVDFGLGELEAQRDSTDAEDSDLGSGGEEAANTIDASIFSPTSSSGFSPVAHGGGDVEVLVEHLNRDIAHLASTMEECVSREVCSQLAQGITTLFRRESAGLSTVRESENAGQGALAAPHAAPQLVDGRPLALSDLARRRRFCIYALQTIRRSFNGGRPVSEQACSRVPEGSPGTRIQAAARRAALTQDSDSSSPGEPLLPPGMMGLPLPFAGFSSPENSRHHSPERDVEDTSDVMSPGARIQSAAQPLTLAGSMPSRRGELPDMLQTAMGGAGLGVLRQAPLLPGLFGTSVAGLLQMPEVANHFTFLTATESPTGSHHGLYDTSPMSLTESVASSTGQAGLNDFCSYSAGEEGSPRRRR